MKNYDELIYNKLEKAVKILILKKSLKKLNEIEKKEIDLSFLIPFKKKELKSKKEFENFIKTLNV